MFQPTSSANRSGRRNFSHAENVPPSKKLQISHRSSPYSTKKRRTGDVQSKYNMEQAKRRSQKKAVRVNIACPQTRTIYPSPSTDVEMAEPPRISVTQPAGRREVPVQLPRALGQPSYAEVNQDALKAAFGDGYGSHNSEDLPLPGFVRDELAKTGLRMLATCISAKADPPADRIPSEIEVTINDDEAVDLPTHLLAVYGAKKASPTDEKLQVKLYPVHAQPLAAHCAKLPAFAPSPSTTESMAPEKVRLNADGKRVITLPVRNLCLPSPKTFVTINHWVYTRRAEILYNAFLPYPSEKCVKAFNEAKTAVPTNAETSNGPSESFFTHPHSLAHQIATANDIAATYTPNRILEYVATIHGVWQNMCALGIFDETMWTVLDGCWEVLLRALAVGAGVDIDD